MEAAEKYYSVPPLHFMGERPSVVCIVTLTEVFVSLRLLHLSSIHLPFLFINPKALFNYTILSNPYIMQLW